MSDKKHFDETLFRSQLNQTLQQVEVGESLRNRTLEACRNWLDTEVPLTGPVSEPIQNPDTEPLMRRILPFAGKHAMFFRVAGGLAACVLVVLMIIDVFPRMGASSTASLLRGDNAQMVAGSAATSMEMAEAAPEAASAMDAEVVTSFAKAAGTADVAVKSNGVGSAEAPLPAPEPAAESGAEDTYTVAGGSALEATPDARYGLTAAQFAWQSLPLAASVVPSERPDEAIVRTALNNQEEVKALLEPLPADTLHTTQMFAVSLLPEPLTAESISEEGAFERLLGEGRSDYWALPVFAEDATYLVPIQHQPNTVDDVTWMAMAPMQTANTDGWLQTLSGEEALRQVLSEASGEVVATWQVLDVDSGTGFWVGWRAGGADWVMPFLENPERLGLENLRAYQWDSLVAIVGPLL